jgi:hypothetical protein
MQEHQVWPLALTLERNVKPIHNNTVHASFSVWTLEPTRTGFDPREYGPPPPDADSGADLNPLDHCDSRGSSENRCPGVAEQMKNRGRAML